jgi:ribokinase
MKALCVGGAMIDTIAVIADDRIERMTMRNAETSYLLLEEGRKNEADEISTHCGGGAVNVAVCLARLGHDVATVIKLGQDGRAETLLSRLAEEGVSTRYAMRDGRAPTGASVLLSAHDRNAAIFTFRGANTLLEPHDLRKDAFAADLVYVASLSNESADCFPLIVAHAKAEGAVVATNPGIRQLSARQSEFRDSLSKIDILAVNRVEAGALVPWLVARYGEGGPALTQRPGEVLPDLARRGLAGGGFELSLVRYVTCLMELGPKWVVITNGREGAYIGTLTGIMHVPAVPVAAAGTAGAGDAFNGTFAAAIAERASAEEAATAAAVNSASVIGYVDTQTGLLRRAQLAEKAADLRHTVKISHWPL